MISVSVLHVDITLSITVGVQIDMFIQSLSMQLIAHLFMVVNINISFTLLVPILVYFQQKEARNNVKYGVHIVHEVLDIN